MCGSCKPLELAVSKSVLVAAAAGLAALPSGFALALHDAVTSPAMGDHPGEAAAFAAYLVLADRYFAGERNIGAFGYHVPLTAHTAEMRDGLPARRYVTAEMEPLLASVRKLGYASAVQSYVEEAARPFGVRFATYACGGIAAIRAESFDDYRRWLRESGTQRTRALVDQHRPTLGPTDAGGIASLADLPPTTSTADQLAAVAEMHALAKRLSSASRFAAVAA